MNTITIYDSIGASRGEYHLQFQFLSILLSLYLVVGSVLCERYNFPCDKRVRVEHGFRKKEKSKK
jgi:hypothetical protein